MHGGFRVCRRSGTRLWPLALLWRGKEQEKDAPPSSLGNLTLFCLLAELWVSVISVLAKWILATFLVELSSPQQVELPVPVPWLGTDTSNPSTQFCVKHEWEPTPTLTSGPAVRTVGSGLSREVNPLLSALFMGLGG